MISRGRLLVVALATATVLGLGLSACGSGGSLARAACAHVDRSLLLYQRSQHAATPAQASADYRAAVNELALAQPGAAQAAAQNGQWQALMTIISESPRVPLGLLVHALTAQCAVASSPNGIGS